MDEKIAALDTGGGTLDTGKGSLDTGKGTQEVDTGRGTLDDKYDQCVLHILPPPAPPPTPPTSLEKLMRPLGVMAT